LANLQYIELARLGQRAFCAADGEPTTFALLLSQEIPKRVKFASEQRLLPRPLMPASLLQTAVPFRAAIAESRRLLPKTAKKSHARADSAHAISMGRAKFASRGGLSFHIAFASRGAP
jgi:hypothetical protein